MGFVRRHKKAFFISGSIVLLVLLMVVWAQSAAARGRLMARWDMARGHYKVLRYGLPPLGEEDYARLLRERYGVEIERVAGCVVSESLVDYADAYNKMSAAAITSEYGDDVFEKTFEDAQRTALHRRSRTTPSLSTVKYLFDMAPESKQDAVCFREFAPGAKMEDIAQRCGRPDEETGTDEYVFVYHLEHGASIRIRTPYLSKVAQIIYTDSSGKQMPIASRQ